MTVNDSESWKVRAVTYLEKHLADGHDLSRRVGQVLRDVPKPRPELITASSTGAGLDAAVPNAGAARSVDSWPLLKRRLNDYVNGAFGLVVFEHFLARTLDPASRQHARSLLAHGDDVYYAAASANDVAYGLASSFHTTAFCLQGIGLEQLRRADGSIDVTAAAEHTVAVFASAYDHEAYIGARIR